MTVTYKLSDIQCLIRNVAIKLDKINDYIFSELDIPETELEIIEEDYEILERFYDRYSYDIKLTKICDAIYDIRNEIAALHRYINSIGKGYWELKAEESENWALLDSLRDEDLVDNILE